jgi:protein TonB
MKRCLIAVALIGLFVVAGCGKEDTSKSRQTETSTTGQQETSKSGQTEMSTTGQQETPKSGQTAVDTLQEAAAGEFEPFDTPPSVIDSATPVYPEEARQQQLEGSVRVKVIVGADGLVESAEVLESTGGPILERAAVEAARSYRFTPATRDGVAIRSVVALPFHFKLSG